VCVLLEVVAQVMRLSADPVFRGMKQFKTKLIRLIVLIFGLAMVNSSTGQGLVAEWSNTITNPAPDVGDAFGVSVAAVGADLVLVGAMGDRTGPSEGGSAFLMSSQGDVITTFTNPAPTEFDVFGSAVAALGNDRVIVSNFQDQSKESYEGAVYLFNTNGSLLKSIHSPIPEASELFGWSVASVAGLEILVGAPSAGEGFAFLLDTNGMLITTFRDPLTDSGIGGSYGEVVSSFGNDRVLIGDPRAGFHTGTYGAVHLFATNGTLLTTITNPIPELRGDFGTSITAVGTRGIVVGDPFSDIQEDQDGTAYYYDTNGVLLTTFTNPYPALAKYFGGLVSSYDENLVIINAALPPDFDNELPCRVFVFGVDGELMTELLNPNSFPGDFFGSAPATASPGRIYVGSLADNTGAAYAGVVHAFGLHFVGPELVLIRSVSDYHIIWESGANEWTLQESISIGPPIPWNDALRTVESNGTTNTVTIPVGEAGNARFFRLRESE